MKIKLKAKILVDGIGYNVEGDSLKDLTHQIIIQTFYKEKENSKNKTDAVLNASVILNIDEQTVWRHIRKEKERKRLLKCA